MTQTKYIIEPYKGFNGIYFGDHRDDVRKKVGAYKEFRKGKFSKNTTDDFGNFHAFYDEENKLEAVEFFQGDVFFNGERLFPNTKQQLVLTLKHFCEDTFSSDSSVGSKSLGVESYTVAEDAEALLIGRCGYFDYE